MHLDILVPDAEAADNLIRSRGATLLKDQGTFRTYADPVGHPFCLYPDSSRAAGPVIGRLVFDCYSPRSLAGFYEGLLGISARAEDLPDRVVIDLGDPDLPNLAFQHAQFRGARWPDPRYPAQLHVDYRFPDGAEAAKARVERLGAIALHETVTWGDPAGHPFCL